MSRRLSWLALAVILSLGLALRALPLGREGLWMDEVFSASFASLRWFEIPVAVLRFDVHPPGYYMQLAWWSQIADSDTGLLLNSVCWSLLTVLLGYHVVAQRVGRPQALLAALCLALCGSEVYYATELRMYAMVSTCMLLAWHLTDRFLTRPTRGLGWALWGVLVVLSLLHSVAFLFVGAVLVHLFTGQWLSRGRLWPPRAHVLIAVLAVLALLPWLANASFRSLSHTVKPDLDVVAVTFAGWIMGYFPGLTPLQVQGGAAVVVALVLGLLVWGQPRQRLLVGAYVIFPVLLVAGVSVLYRSIWLDRTLAFCAPALCVALCLRQQPDRPADAHTRAPVWVVPAMVVALALVWTAQLPQREQLPRKMQFREAAAYLTELAQARGHLDVHVPQNIRFWGLARYLAGPRWGSLLAVQDPERVDDSQAWPRIYRRLGPDALARLHLVPQQRHLDVGALRLWIGLSPLPDAVLSQGHVLVEDLSAAKRMQGCPLGVVLSRKVFPGVSVVQCGPATAQPLF